MKAVDARSRYGSVHRAAILMFLEMLHAARRFHPASRGRGVIFTLHHVRPALAPSAFQPNGHLEVTPEFLDAAISALFAEGYEPVALEDVPARLAAPGGRRFFAMTLDDGYRDNRDHALPVFRKHGVPCTVFVTKGYIERSHTMWWRTAEALIAKGENIALDLDTAPRPIVCASSADKVRAFGQIAAVALHSRQDEAIDALDRSALSSDIDPLALVDEAVMDADELRSFSADPLVSLGAHSVSHASLAHLDEARLYEELRGSRDTVAAITGRPPKTFAYPYGKAAAASEREFRAAARAGYEIAVTTVPGILAGDAMTRAPMALPRISLNGYFQKPRYVTALASGLAFR